MSNISETQSQEVFQRLKSVCVPLLGASHLSPASISNVSKLLGELIIILSDVKASGFSLTTSLISYTFFPLSTLLRRNTASDIPDQILEKVFVAMSILCEEWWWDCDFAVWEQIFMLCGAVLGGIEGKGKGKDRDEETKQAAAQCLLALLHQREPEGRSTHSSGSEAQERLDFFKSQARTNNFLPILGQTLDAVLTTVESRHLPLQRISLELLWLLIDVYAPDDLIPTVLPGVISRITKVALGSSKVKGWANGEIVARALRVMEAAIVRAVGDDICTKEGAIKVVADLEDLAEMTTDQSDRPSNTETRPYSTSRTASWLRGTSSQLLIAMNTLTPFVSHPTPSALLALSKFSATIIHATSLTLPHAQPLLLHFLLSLSNSDVPSVSNESRKSLMALFTIPSRAQHPLLQTLVRIVSDNLSALPRLLPTHADTKVEHAAGLVEAACRLASTESKMQGRLMGISAGIGQLLGPSGGVEKWGWSLLSVLEFVEPAITDARTSSAQLMLESNPDTSQWVPFPELAFKNVFASSTRDALERMFRALGRAAGDACLFSVEWFANVGRSGRGSRSVAAAWCACRLLEGVADISLLHGITGDAITPRRSKRLGKLARTIARNMAELWDEPSRGEANPPPQYDIRDEDPSNNLVVQHVKGVAPIHENLRITKSSPATEIVSAQQPILHKALSLQLLAVSAGVLQAQFTPLFIYTLYPVLHSLVSPNAYLSSTALATLNFITIMTSYASPSNLLLANFDYSLDAVSRRLSRRWLDVDATKVLALMVRLVGSDVVEKAGDVVEECFDRLDEFHGYGVIVEGLVEVLGEVVTVIKNNAEIGLSDLPKSSSPSREPKRHESLDSFFEWFAHRHDQPEPDTYDYGPAPREAWGASKETEPDDGGDNPPKPGTEPDSEPPPTPVQALTKQIVSRSLYFLTHESPVIRAKILLLLSSSVSVLPESAILPSIHSAWPFILNRLGDPESFVVSATATLIEALVTRFGSFMFRRIWDDVWPRFLALLNNLDAADTTSALSRRGHGAVGTESAYTHSHRLYRSLIKTMTAAAKGVHPHDASNWQVLLAFRRFLHRHAHDELQHCARDLYLALGENNVDAVWLALSSTMDEQYPTMKFLRARQWEIDANVAFIFRSLGI